MSIHHNSPFVTTFMYFLPTFFEFFENKRSFVCLRASAGRRKGFGATQTVVYCVYLRARYGADDLLSHCETRHFSGFLLFVQGFFPSIRGAFLFGAPSHESLLQVMILS